MDFEKIMQKYKNIEKEDWILLYEYSEFPTSYYTFSFIIDKDSENIEKNLEYPEWNFLTSNFGVSQYIGDDERTLSIGDKMDEFEYLVCERRFENNYPDILEINYKLIWYYNLLKTDNGYINPSNGELLIKINNNKVEIDKMYLMDFLAAHKKVCISYICNRVANIEEIEKDESKVEKEENKYIFQYTKMRNINNTFKTNAFHELIGKILIEGLSEPKHRSYITYYKKTNDFETFIVDYDIEGGKEVFFTCDISMLSNLLFDINTENPEYMTPIYFDMNVLSKYKSDSRKYSISNEVVEKLSEWGFYIPYSINKENLVTVWLGDLGRLPYKEQQYWKLYNKIPKGGVEEGFLNNQKYGIRTESSDFILKFSKLLHLVNENTEKFYGDIIFNKLSSGDKEVWNKFSMPLNNSLESLKDFILNLSKILIESINVKFLKKEVSGDLKEKRSIDVLEIFLEQKNINENCNIIKVLRNVYDMRNCFAHSMSIKRYNKINGRDQSKAINVLEDSKQVIKEVNEELNNLLNNIIKSKEKFKNG